MSPPTGFDSSQTGRTALPLDYDENPDRFRTGRAVVLEYGPGQDVHSEVATRLVDEGVGSVLDVGCGDGALGRLLLGTRVRWIGLDLSARLLADAPRPVVRGSATRLPFPDAAFGAVTALYMLYHLPEPALAVQEAQRVVRPGGLYAVAAPSRYDSPEIEHLVPPEPPSTFDAEIAPELLGRFFGSVEVLAWDGPYIRLPDVEALRRYMVGRGVDPAIAAECAPRMSFPLAITKRGALVVGQK